MRRRLIHAGGFTLVEVMVAALVLVVGVLGVLAMLDGANAQSLANRTRVGATNLARELTEDARTVDYDKLTPSALPTALAEFPDIGGTGSPITVMRRGTTYTVQVGVCAFDDPKDGQSTTAPVNPCYPAPASVTQSDPNPDDARRLTLTITWDRGPGARRLQQTVLISNPSGGLGPRITQFDGPSGQVTSGTSAHFPTTTTAGTAAVHWSSDGLNGSGDSTGGPTIWTTDWNLGTAATPLAITSGNVPPSQYSSSTVLDGVYTVTAQAFDDRGVAGDSRVAVLSLNRSLPLTVSSVSARFNGNVTNPSVYVTWTPNPENDIIGYHVYRSPDLTIGDANDRLVSCQGSTLVDAKENVCADDDPYQGSSVAQTVYYYVKAVDLSDITSSGSTRRESPYASAQSVGLPDRSQPVTVKPAAPTNVQLDGSAFRSPTLTWSHSDLTNIDYFWIYRDSCTPADRYQQTAGNGTTWLDTSPGSGPHTYYVTAVSKLNGYESDCSGGVPWP